MINWPRRDFPLLARQPKLVYLDSASSSQVPAAVIRAMSDWYTLTNANVHRAGYDLAEAATLAYETARQTVAGWFGVTDSRAIVFTKGATEGLNAVAAAWGETNLHRGDVILLSEMEHHANLLPWQQLAARRGLKLRYWPITADGRLTPSTPALWRGVKLVAITHVSNVLGTINPIDKVIREASRRGAVSVIDGAQSAAHLPINLTKLSPDFFVAAGHKLLGPTGVGVLFVHPRRWSELAPYQTGGEMIESVDWQTARFAPMPQLLEAGTPPLAAAVGLAAALNYLSRHGGVSMIAKHSRRLTTALYRGLTAIPGVAVVGPAPRDRTGVVSFNVNGLHAHDLAALLNQKNIAVRAGHHCAQPLHRRLRLAASVRASVGPYTTDRDVATFLRALRHSLKLWHNLTNK